MNLATQSLCPCSEQHDPICLPGQSNCACQTARGKRRPTGDVLTSDCCSWMATRRLNEMWMAACYAPLLVLLHGMVGVERPSCLKPSVSSHSMRSCMRQPRPVFDPHCYEPPHHRSLRAEVAGCSPRSALLFPLPLSPAG